MTFTPTGEHVTDLVFPLSPDYVRDWTSDRAIAEIISNAIDADENFQVTYTDGVLEITDNADGGVGTAAMVLGHTTKTGRSDLIGQFGEGLKVGLLVLLRDKKVKSVMVDTVGYCFTTELVRHAALSELGLGQDQDAPQVMSWKIHRSDRKRGTVVKIACPEKLAQQAMNRFLHLRTVNYCPPAEAEVIAGMKGGSLYIGGVLVSAGRKLRYSYDLPLSLAKGWQNRDRTVIDSWQLTGAVQKALCSLNTPEQIAELAEATINGELSTTEASWVRLSSSLDAKTRKAWHAEGKRRWPDGKVFYQPAGSNEVSEQVLDLEDRGFMEFAPAKMSAWDRDLLAKLLGIEPVKAKSRKSADSSKPTWAKTLTESQQSVLDEGIALVRKLYGNEALDKVKVFTKAGVASAYDPDHDWHGFYDPRTGLVAVHLEVLDSLADLMPVLIHESAHRIAHRCAWLVGIHGYVSYTDRSRGFEQVLHQMAAKAALATLGGATAEAEQPKRTVIPGMEWNTASATALPMPVTSAQAANLVRARLEDWGKRNQVKPRGLVAEFSRQTFTSARVLSMLLKGNLKISGAYLQPILDLAQALDLDGPTLWWATVGAQGRYEYHYPSGSWRARTRFGVGKEAKVMFALMREQGVDEDLLAHLASMTEKKAALPEDDSWLRPVRQLLQMQQSPQELDLAADVKS